MDRERFKNYRINKGHIVSRESSSNEENSRIPKFDSKKLLVKRGDGTLESKHVQKNIHSDIKDAINQRSYTNNGIGFTSASFNLNHNQSLNTPVTPQQEKGILSKFSNDKKRTSHSGSSRKNTKYIDLNEPNLNFSYVGKPGDDIVLRMDRQGIQFKSKSELKKDDEATKRGNKKEIGKKIEVIEEKLVSLGDNGTLNPLTVIPNNEDDVLKLAMSLMKLDKDSGGRMKGNVREDTRGLKYFKIGSNPEISDNVMYFEDTNKREVRCDSFILKLFRSNIFVGSLIFVLLVVMIILLLIIFHMRSVKNHKYEKVNSGDFSQVRKPVARKKSQALVPRLTRHMMAPSVESVKILLSISSSSGDDSTAYESKKINQNNVTNGESKTSEQQKAQSSKVSTEKHRQGHSLKSNVRKHNHPPGTKIKVQKSNTESPNRSTNIKDLFLSSLQKVYSKTTDDSDSESNPNLKTTLREKRKKKTLKKKRNTQTQNVNLGVDLESMVTDAEFTSSPSLPPDPEELINKIVATGESKKIDTMLTGQAWQRSFYYGQGIRTLDYESFDNQPGVRDIMAENGETDEVKTLGAVKQCNSSQALQDEIGKCIEVAEGKIKKARHPPTYDLENK